MANILIDRKFFKDAIRNGVGLGDIVAMATKAVGIKPCAGCKKRQITLNKIKLPVFKKG